MIESHNFCTVFKNKIDHHLVNVLKPACIEEMGGCCNCPKIGYRMSVEATPGIQKNVSRFEYAIMQIADPEAAKACRAYTEKEENEERLDKIRSIVKRLRIKRDDGTRRTRNTN